MEGKPVITLAANQTAFGQMTLLFCLCQENGTKDADGHTDAGCKTNHYKSPEDRVPESPSHFQGGLAASL
ncbi:MAG: hypothetical protein U0V70_05835 [Terriglobia bacterium]